MTDDLPTRILALIPHLRDGDDENGFAVGAIAADVRSLEETVRLWREPVRWFAGEMERKLRLNDHKGHWKNCTMDYLFRRLREEVQELENAVNARSTGKVTNEAMVAEAADVANFAMMIADLLRAGKESP